MALADYRLCDVCGGKAFYDADLDYKYPNVGADYEYGTRPIRGCNMALGYLGDWAVLCTNCAKTHKTVIVPIEERARVME